MWDEPCAVNKGIWGQWEKAFNSDLAESVKFSSEATLRFFRMKEHVGGGGTCSHMMKLPVERNAGGKWERHGGLGMYGSDPKLNLILEAKEVVGGFKQKSDRIWFAFQGYHSEDMRRGQDRGTKIGSCSSPERRNEMKTIPSCIHSAISSFFQPTIWSACLGKALGKALESVKSNETGKGAA